MFKKLNEFDNKYSGLFLCFALLIIIVFLFYISQVNRNKEKECSVPNEIVNNYSNYSYDVSITRNNIVTQLSIKRYNSKYLIEKNDNGIKTTYYLYHTDLLEKASNGKYIKYRKDYIVDGIDNKLLVFDYINEISLKSTLSNDGELTCYNNRKMELSMCINLDDSITLEGNGYTIVYSVKNVGTIEDFDVDTDLIYEDNSTNDTELNNNVVQ